MPLFSAYIRRQERRPLMRQYRLRLYGGKPLMPIAHYINKASYFISLIHIAALIEKKGVLPNYYFIGAALFDDYYAVLLFYPLTPSRTAYIT